MVFVEFGERAFEGEFTASDLQALDEIAGSHKQDAPSVLDEREPDRCRDMTLAAAGSPDAQRETVAIARGARPAPVPDAWMCAWRWRPCWQAQWKLPAWPLHEGDANAASGDAGPETGGQRPDPETPGLACSAELKPGPRCKLRASSPSCNARIV
jgi:hypothetical protein